MREQSRHKNISVEEIAMLEQSGLVHAGYDPIRNKEVFHRSLRDSTTTDPKMLAREYYNNTKYDLYIRRIGPSRFKPGSLPTRWEFKERPFPTDSFCFCPHGYYGVYHRDGTPFEGGLHTNVGERMFKGEKLLSRPEVSTKVYRGK